MNAVNMTETEAQRQAQRDNADLALEAMCAVVGHPQVRADRGTRERYARSTCARSTYPLAIVTPSTAAQVVALVKIAGQFQVPIYPLSTGKNWGYGDACAVGDGQIIIELSRMNRIISVDPSLAYAVIEPGVTQQQLADYLRAHQLDLWADCTGAGPDTSFMGNILERGFGHSPYGNRLQHVAGMQVVLASGEVLETGFGHYPNARVTHLFPYGVGPFLDGIFTQSNFGIVTRIGIWLMPKSECLNHFMCTVPKHEDIAAVVDALRPLRLNGTLRSVLHIGNDLRVISGGSVSPRGKAKGGIDGGKGGGTGANNGTGAGGGACVNVEPTGKSTVSATRTSGWASANAATSTSNVESTAVRSSTNNVEITPNTSSTNNGANTSNRANMSKGSRTSNRSSTTNGLRTSNGSSTSGATSRPGATNSGDRSGAADGNGAKGERVGAISRSPVCANNYSGRGASGIGAVGGPESGNDGVETHPSCALPDALRERLRVEAGVGAWTVSGALYGSKLQVAAARHALRRALKGTAAKSTFITARSLVLGALLGKMLGSTQIGRRLRAKVALGDALFSMNRGVPNGRFLAGAYWRRRGGLPDGFPRKANPAQDNCGLLWVSPILPMRGEDLLAVHALAVPIFKRHDFDLFVTFSMVNERTLGGVITIAFDKEDPREVARAKACYQQLFDAMMGAGYIPYRVGNQSMAALDPHGDVYWKTVARIKAALDPDGLISPGRYAPAQAKAAEESRQASAGAAD
jgi:FAD/FMN-containing dehydrogenase